MSLDNNIRRAVRQARERERDNQIQSVGHSRFSALSRCEKVSGMNQQVADLRGGLYTGVLVYIRTHTHTHTPSA